MAIQLVDITLRNILQAMIQYVVADYNSKPATESWLYRVFNGVVYNKFDFFKQAVKIIVINQDNSYRKLEIRTEFNATQAKTPSIFINVPSEREGGENGLGVGQSDENYYENQDGSYTEKYIRDFTGTYELMITSDNSEEVKLIYEFIKAMLVSLYDTFDVEFAGTRTMGGKQLMGNHQFTPDLYMRVVTISMVSRTEVPRIDSNLFLDAIQFVQNEITI